MKLSRRQAVTAAVVMAAASSGSLSSIARTAERPKIRLVVLDIGGTIIEDHGEVPNAMHAALGRQGFDVSFAEIADWRGASKREMVRHFVEQKTKAAAENRAVIDTIYRDFTDQVSRAYVNVKPIAGAEDAMKEMRASGYLLATTTGFDRPLTRAILHRLNWEPLFAASITSDDVVDGRPAPYMLFHAMEAARVDNVQEVIAVGDTPLDLQAANNGGLAAAIGVYSGAATEERLRREKYTEILPSVAALPALLRARF
jgi:phosphonatase-like hydrolase